MNINDLVSKVYGVPHYASTRQVRNVLIALDNHFSGKYALTEKDYRQREEDIIYDENLNLGVLQVRGVLSNEESGWDSFCGITSYERLKGEFDLLVEKGIDKLVLDIDSGGGEAYGCFETAMYVKQKAQENNIKIYSYVDGFAASAAYAWASIADEIYMNPAAEVGSIGVVIRLSKASADDYTFVYAGDNKIPYDAEGNYSESFLNGLQAKVDFLYDDFVNHVAENRNLSVEAIKQTQANTYLRDEALKLGLVDFVATKEEFKTHIESLNKQEKRSMFGTKQTATTASSDLEQYVLEIEDLKAKLEESATQNAELIKEFESTKLSLQQKNDELDQFKKEVRENNRKASLVNVFGAESEEVSKYLSSFAEVDDTAFELLVSGLSGKKEANRKEFTEVGEQSDAPTPKSYADTLKERARATNTVKKQ